jgi:hypothetical protein
MNPIAAPGRGADFPGEGRRKSPIAAHGRS